jgi:hypothetical protein
MAQHQINFTIDLTADEEAALCDVLGGQTAQLALTLAPYGAAALREYVDMFAGQAMTNATDLRDRRLAAILLALSPAQFPTDDRIARAFNLPTSSARALLRTTLSRHRNRLRHALEAAARQFLAACQQQPDQSWEARFPNAVIVQMLNDQLAQATQPRSPIKRKPGTFDTYVVPNGSHIELKLIYP